MFFQIHRDGQAVDGSSYPSLAEASAALEKSKQGGEVAEVDAMDRIVRRYTLHECRMARRTLRRLTRTPGTTSGAFDVIGIADA